MSITHFLTGANLASRDAFRDIDFIGVAALRLDSMKDKASLISKAQGGHIF